MSRASLPCRPALNSFSQAAIRMNACSDPKAAFLRGGPHFGHGIPQLGRQIALRFGVFSWIDPPISGCGAFVAQMAKKPPPHISHHARRLLLANHREACATFLYVPIPPTRCITSRQIPLLTSPSVLNSPEMPPPAPFNPRLPYIALVCTLLASHRISFALPFHARYMYTPPMPMSTPNRYLCLPKTPSDLKTQGFRPFVRS